MGDLFELIFTVGLFTGLLALGYGIGHLREGRHFRSLAIAEQELAGISLSNLKRMPAGIPMQTVGLVTGQAVIATDYFKGFAAGLRNLFGGEVRCLELLVERARREAIVRMLREASEQGADTVINLRCETAAVGGMQQKQVGGVEVIVYGTALRSS